MNKTDQLLKMLEHPERYTEQQWLDILADEECRELYSLMAKTRSALASEQADNRLTDEMIDEQWQRLAAREQHQRAAVIVPLWRKVAAAVAVVVACVGIAIAAVQTGLLGSKSAEKQPEQVTLQHGQDGITSQEATALPTNTITAAHPRLFEETPLEQILAELAAHYGVEVEYRSDDVRHLRLFYQWEPEYSLDKVVEMLNNFEAFSIRHEYNRLIVEPRDAK